MKCWLFGELLEHMLLALSQLEAPAHIVGLTSPNNSSHQHSLLRYLYLRYLHVPDDGQDVTQEELFSWSTSVGVVPTPPATTPPHLHFNPSQLTQLTQTVASMVTFDKAQQLQPREHPSQSLLTSIAAAPDVFTSECQLFPFDLQWIVNAANAAPGQFTPSLDALQVELEQSQASCTALLAQDDATFNTTALDEALTRGKIATAEMPRVARTTSTLLQEFSAMYQTQFKALMANQTEMPQCHAGKIAFNNVSKLQKVLNLMQQLQSSKKNFDGIEELLRMLEEKKAT